MIYTNEQLRFKLGSYCKIKTAVKRGEYFKVSHGLYSDESPYLNEMESIFARYPEAILIGASLLINLEDQMIYFIYNCRCKDGHFQ